MNEDLFEPLTDVDDTNPLNTDSENWIEFEHVCSSLPYVWLLPEICLLS